MTGIRLAKVRYGTVRYGTVQYSTCATTQSAVHVHCTLYMYSTFMYMYAPLAVYYVYINEALLCIMNVISVVTIIVAVVALKVKPKPKTSTTHTIYSKLHDL